MSDRTGLKLDKQGEWCMGHRNRLNGDLVTVLPTSTL